MNGINSFPPGWHAPQNFHDVPLEAATNNFDYDDSVVCVRVGGRVFRVSKSRLVQRVPVFKDMFSLPQTDGADSQEVVLHNDPDDFYHFLWFVHADAIDLAGLANDPPTTRLTRYLGIAMVAQMYDAIAISEWALQELVKELDCRSFILPQIMAKLVVVQRQRGRIDSIATKLRTAMRRTLYSLAHLNAAGRAFTADLADMVPVLDHALATQLLALTYYYILVYRSDNWAQDPKLRPVDRLRLLCGAQSLRQRGLLTAADNREEYSMTGTVDKRIKGLENDLWSFFDPAAWKLPTA
ncbi:hypothetical protein EXIGLDRAFT_768981 [Exidia glandulosa HHB12029]|uniref:BTB domain-containing protein n=1 Tax=Exidia glandulosa HHB12029 TaxID=1314781 RepID=A0A165HT78_EXIGL|nr:hypothetical protein EXIGLDRAFT_768981 [Exidia glandulosa HHB12029]